MSRFFCQSFRVRKSYDQQLSEFFRKCRGDLSYRQFGVKIGVPHHTVSRIERGEHHITLRKLESILGKLKVKLGDVFPGEY